MIAALVALALAPQPFSTEAIEAASAYSKAQNGTAMLVMIDGHKVYEDYTDSRPRLPRVLASGTKSFSGVMAAIAEQEGLLKLDELASDMITEWKSDPLKSKITVRHLLNLSSGLEPGENGDPPSYADAIKKPCQWEPGSKFEYGNTHFQAFGELMKRKLAAKDMTVMEYLDAKILRPLGINGNWWKGRAEGEPDLGGGAALTPQDWASFGQMVLQNGKWADEQIVKPDLLARCFESSQANTGYGLTWWLARPVSQELINESTTVRLATDIFRQDLNGLPKDIVMAAGAGKQRLIVIPSHKAVIVRNGGGASLQELNRNGVGFSDLTFLKLLLDQD